MTDKDIVMKYYLKFGERWFSREDVEKTFEPGQYHSEHKLLASNNLANRKNDPPNYSFPNSFSHLQLKTDAVKEFTKSE